jgi:hypothetical protein
VLALHCSHTVAVRPHALQTLTTLPARTSCRYMIALTSGALKTCTRALRTCVARCIGRLARLFFILETHGTQRAVGHVVAPEPISAGRRGPEPQDTRHRRSSPQSGGEVRSHRTCGSTGVHLNQEASSGAAGHRQRQSPHQSGDKVRSHRTRGSAGAHFSREARSGAVGHVAECGYTSCCLS